MYWQCTSIGSGMEGCPEERRALKFEPVTTPNPSTRQEENGTTYSSRGANANQVLAASMVQRWEVWAPTGAQHVVLITVPTEVQCIYTSADVSTYSVMTIAVKISRSSPPRNFKGLLPDLSSKRPVCIVESFSIIGRPLAQLGYKNKEGAWSFETQRRFMLECYATG